MTNPLTKIFKSLRSSWYLWLFPAAALVISAWLFVGYYNQRGDEIKILFDEAAMIHPEKTQVRYRGVTIGVVKSLEISEDGKDVIANVTLQRTAKHFATEGSKFWVVVPKVNFQGVSGLETLFEGSYIAATPGEPGAAKKTVFNGRVGNTSTDPLDETSSYILETAKAGSVSVGDAVSFRGVNVGKVSKVYFSKSAQTVLVQINVENRYVHLIRENTNFWRAVGIQAKLGLFNSEVKVNSLDSLLHGGIEFFTPDDVGAVAKANSKFRLHGNPPKDVDKWNPNLEVK